jgi:hypothetical protein
MPRSASSFLPFPIALVRRSLRPTGAESTRSCTWDAKVAKLAPATAAAEPECRAIEMNGLDHHLD